MKTCRWMMVALMGCACILTGCKDSKKDDSPPPPPANGPGGNGDTQPDPSANEQFASVIPSGLRLRERFTIVGRGTTYVLECSPIAGAVSYTFTTSFGATEAADSNSIGILRAGADEPFTFSVYATNAEGINTRTASRAVNN